MINILNQKPETIKHKPKTKNQ